jgi:hypothetical protein
MLDPPPLEFRDSLFVLVESFPVRIDAISKDLGSIANTLGDDIEVTAGLGSRARDFFAQTGGGARDFPAQAGAGARDLSAQALDGNPNFSAQTAFKSAGGHIYVLARLGGRRRDFVAETAAKPIDVLARFRGRSLDFSAQPACGSRDFPAQRSPQIGDRFPELRLVDLGAFQAVKPPVRPVESPIHRAFQVGSRHAPA